jgi:hypothetical protein
VPDRGAQFRGKLWKEHELVGRDKLYPLDHVRGRHLDAATSCSSVVLCGLCLLQEESDGRRQSLFERSNVDEG